ncbi:MAG TPA: hypothetical protein VGD67_04635 [Pseudonocardiaceae bacterium]
MSRIARRAAVAAAVALGIGWLPALPATAGPAGATGGVATTMVATVGDVQSLEHEISCRSTPGPCDVRYLRRLLVPISTSNFSGAPITYGFVVEGITATAGVDWVPFPHAPADTVTTGGTGSATVALDIVTDTLTEGTETLRVRLTSASRPVVITDTGIGTILDGNQLPPDCAATRTSMSDAHLTCGSRPAGQAWQGRFQCGGFPPRTAIGGTVTGNGTSYASCAAFDENWLMGPVAFRTVP